MHGLAFGVYAMGGLSIASQIALGDIARGHLAMGRNVHGDFVVTGVLTYQRVKDIITQQYPQLWEPLVWLFSTFVSRIH